MIELTQEEKDRKLIKLISIGDIERYHSAKSSTRKIDHEINDLIDLLNGKEYKGQLSFPKEAIIALLRGQRVALNNLEKDTEYLQNNILELLDNFTIEVTEYIKEKFENIVEEKYKILAKLGKLSFDGEHDRFGNKIQWDENGNEIKKDDKGDDS